MRKIIGISVFAFIVSCAVILRWNLYAQENLPVEASSHNDEAIVSPPQVSIPLSNRQPSPSPAPSIAVQSPQILDFSNRQVVSEPALLPEDRVIFDTVMQRAIANHLSQRSMAEIMQAVSEQFLGAPYAEGLLDRSPQETLVTTLNQFDCVLFVESVLALSRGIAAQDYTETTFAQHIREQRYVNGLMDGYCSRLHYFSSWIDNNQQKGLVISLIPDKGGRPLGKALNFMSTHWQSYPQLVRSQSAYDCIVKMESRLDLSQMQYIPYEQIASFYSVLQPGDIVAVATAVPGLDVTHTGLVYQESDGNMGLIHAAPGNGVKISPDLQNFVGSVRDAIGVFIARPVDPRN
jgi:cell wall-associated NlpC family hydrolase